MVKATLAGIIRNGSRMILTFKKDVHFVDLLLKLDKKFGLHIENIFSEEENSTDAIISFSNSVDERYNFGNNGYNVDLIFGQNKVYFILTGDNKKQQEFIDFLSEGSDWIRQ